MYLTDQLNLWKLQAVTPTCHMSNLVSGTTDSTQKTDHKGSYALSQMEGGVTRYWSVLGELA